MQTATSLRLLQRRTFWAALSLLGLMTALAYAQAGARPAAPAKSRMEYLQQEIQSDALVQTLNDLDGQGWELFQIVPLWSLKNENNEANLVPKSYQVFGRRPKMS